MLKENGRLAPATKEELASIAVGKSMFCSKCGKIFRVENAQFADSECDRCGGKLSDINMANSSKATGA